MSLRIGYLPFYVDYYESVSPDFAREKPAVAQRCAEALARHGEVLWDGKLLCHVEAAEAAGKALAKQRPDCIVVVTTIAVFGAVPWAALQHLPVPVLVWNPQGIETVGRGYTMVEIVRHTGQIGTQALANTLVRNGRWFRVVTGYEKGRRMAVRLDRFFSIIRAVTAVKRARLLAIGPIFPAMTDILIDEAAFARELGPTVVHISAGELTERYQAASASRIANTRDLTADEAARSSRLGAALQSLVDEHRADAGTLNCHGACLRNPEIGITACYSLGVQNTQGRPFTCTGDLPTALAMLVLKKLTGISMYTEVQVMDEKRRAVVIANSGEGEDGIRRQGRRPGVRGNTNFTGLRGRGASFAYPLQPGQATLVGFTPVPGGYRLIAAEGQILRETLPDAGALAGFFRFDHPDPHRAYARWMEAGAVHHAATTLGHWTDELRAVAELLQIDFIPI